MTGAELKSRTTLAETLQRRWGCPRAGLKPPAQLPPDLADEARYHAETVGLVAVRVPGKPAPPLPRSHGTCPFAARLSPWARGIAQVLRVTAGTKGAIDVETVLGREPHVWDVRGIDAVLCARADVEESNAVIWERERANDPKAKR